MNSTSSITKIPTRRSLLLEKAMELLNEAASLVDEALCDDTKIERALSHIERQAMALRKEESEDVKEEEALKASITKQKEVDLFDAKTPDVCLLEAYQMTTEAHLRKFIKETLWEDRTNVEITHFAHAVFYINPLSQNIYSPEKNPAKRIFIGRLNNALKKIDRRPMPFVLQEYQKLLLKKR